MKHPTKITFLILLVALVSTILVNRELNSTTGKDDVVVYVLDSFSQEKDSHGKMVSDIIRKASFGKCEVKISLAGRSSVKREEYLKRLTEIAKEIKINPEKKYLINISFGSYSPDPLEYALIKILHQEGVVIVAAAGNDDTSSKQYPAGYRETIAVAASTKDSKTDYSNYGEHIDITVSGFGKKEILKREKEREGPIEKTTIHYLIKAGTSFSAPRVTGLLAYLIRQRSDLTPEEIIATMKEKAAPLKDGFFHREQLGAGILDFEGTLSEVDPCFQKIESGRTISLIATALIVFIAITISNSISHDKNEALPFFIISAFVFLVFGFIGDPIIKSQMGILKGNAVSSIWLVALALIIAWNYCFRTYKEEEARKRREEERKAEKVTIILEERP